MSEKKTAGNKDGKKYRKLNKRMRKKLAGLFVFVVLALICLLIRVTVISATKGDQYKRQVLARSQARYASTAMAYKRGDILDTSGTVLATSEKRYNVILDCYIVNSDPEHFTEPTIAALTEFFGIDGDGIRQLLLDDKTKESRYQVVKRKISVEEKQAFDQFKAEASDLTKDEAARNARKNVRGIWFEEEYVRTYPLGSLAGDLLGFVYDTDKADWGLEGYYNNTLCGVDGRKYGYFGSDSEIEQTIVDPKDGDSIRITLDVNIQTIVQNTINRFLTVYADGPVSKNQAAKNVGVLVMDPRNGAILAMASSGEYDPNNPRDLSPYYTEAQITAMSDEQKVNSLNEIWKNFCISDSFEPGSVFKPITVSSALENAAINESSHFVCDGYETVSGIVIKCSNNEGHGEESLGDVVKNSCNDGLMQIGSSLGVDHFCRYQQMFGFGQRTGIDLAGEASGIIGAADTMGAVDLATASFGQGFTCTMIQEANAFSTVINGGYYYRPHLLSQVIDASGNVRKNAEKVLLRQAISSDVSADLREYMRAGVEEGTSQYAKVNGYSMGGKTGTAQKIPRGNGKYLVSWIGFVPYDDPQLVIYCIVDEPNVRDQADNRYPQWIARDILQEVLPYLGIYPDEPMNPDNEYLKMDLETAKAEENSANSENEDEADDPRSEWYYNDDGDLVNGDGHMIDDHGFLINDDREYVDENDQVVDEAHKTMGRQVTETSEFSDTAADTNVPEIQGHENTADTSGGNTAESDGFTNEEAGYEEEE